MNWCETLKTKLIDNAPKMLGLPARLMPLAAEQLIFDSILTPLFKEAIDEGELDFLMDKVLKIEVSDMQKHWYFTLENQRLKLCENTATSSCDLCFSGPMNSFVLLASQKADADTLFFKRQLTIEGDTELGLEVKNLVARLNLDDLPKPFALSLKQYSELLQAG